MWNSVMLLCSVGLSVKILKTADEISFSWKVANENIQIFSRLWRMITQYYCAKNASELWLLVIQRLFRITKKISVHKDLCRALSSGTFDRDGKWRTSVFKLKLDKNISTVRSMWSLKTYISITQCHFLTFYKSQPPYVNLSLVHMTLTKQWINRSLLVIQLNDETDDFTLYLYFHEGF